MECQALLCILIGSKPKVGKASAPELPEKLLLDLDPIRLRSLFTLANVLVELKFKAMAFY
jgi:hypothetical protein